MSDHFSYPAHNVNFTDDDGKTEVIKAGILAPKPSTQIEQKTFTTSGSTSSLDSPVALNFDSTQVETVIATDKPMPTPFATSALSLSNPLNFLSSALSPSGTLRCYIVKSGGTLTSAKYELYLEDGDVLIGVATKKSGITSGTRHHYRIEAPAEIKSSIFVKVGKVLDNVLGDTYTGVVGSKHSSKEVSIKQESSLVCFDLNMLGLSGRPRQMTAAIKLNLSKPTSTDLTTRLKHAQKTETGNGQSDKTNFDNESMCLITKKPIWDKRLKCYSLNFYGRSKLPSTKSFQLVSWHSQPNDVLLQFAKLAKNKYSLDAVGPLTPLQAFQIALSSVDRKMAID